MEDKAGGIRNLKNKEKGERRKQFGSSLYFKSEKKVSLEKEEAEQEKKDMELYAHVWSIKPHWCENCGIHLGRWKKLNMHHLLPKKPYPQFRHTPDNIMLLCLQCHSKAETNIDFAPKIKELTEQTKKLLLNE